MATDPPRAEAGFDSLLKDIMENPERVLDKSITPEQILALQKRMNPYAYVAGGGGAKQRAVAASYTNLRADYLRRFTMTSLVGFLFRMHDEWVVPPEARRWVSKAGAKRERAARAARGTEPYSPAELLERAQALAELAQLAKEAEAEAGAAQEAAAAADQRCRERELAEGEAPEAARAEAAALLQAADRALAKARGLQYAATYSMRKLGLACDDRIDALAERAREFPEVREIIDKDPIVRPPPGQLEVPPAVAKNIITQFLRGLFEFNPDAHVRSAYDEFKIGADLGAADVPGLGAVPVDTKDPPRLPLAVVRAAPPAFASPEDAAAFAALTAGRDGYRAAAYALRNESFADGLRAALAAPERFRRYLFPVPPASPARPAVEKIPPRDTFHRWEYYQEVNYEELRTATAAVYDEKPDLDWALILYEYFEGDREKISADFEAFRDRHQDEVISDIKGIDLGAWTLLGDFKENRAKIAFYNKHTEVLKRILDRHAEDKKLGQELMRNRVRRLKAKNVREAGPDDPGLAEYREASSGLGAEKVISREEMHRINRAKGDLRAAQELEVIDGCRKTIAELSAAAKVRPLSSAEEGRLKDAQADLVRAEEMVEVPDDSIQVDVWTHDSSSGSFGKSKFYTKAEAPEPRPLAPYAQKYHEEMMRGEKAAHAATAHAAAAE